jgi:hypothetical protein
MKASQLTRDEYAFVGENISTFHAQRYKESLESLESAIRYLFLSHAGGAVAVLSYLGSSSRVEQRGGPLYALACFSAGLLIVGLLYGFRAWYFPHRLRTWNDTVNKFLSDQIEHDEMYRQYFEKTKEPLWPYAAAVVAFLFLLTGIGIGYFLLW